MSIANLKHATCRRRRRAQHLVEFALVLPVLITLFGAIIDIGWLFFQDHTVNSAARAAARIGACQQGLTGSAATTADADLRTFVRNFCGALNVQNSNILIQVINAGGGGTGTVQGNTDRTAGFDVRVSVTHNLTFFTPIQSIFRQANLTRVRAESQYIID